MSPIDPLMTQAIRDGVFPAAELLVAKDGITIHHNHYGAAQPGTVFDIASLTKPVATATRAMQLTAEHRLALDAPLIELLPESAKGPYATVTCRQLLNHTAGFPAWQPYYRSIGERQIGTPAARTAIIAKVLAEPPQFAAGERGHYSDLGYILLGEILERIDGRGLEIQFAELIAEPLGLSKTCYLPLAQSERACVDTNTMQFAPTEDCPWRHHVMRGAVHDHNCYAMGGVAGHAGLFSTAADLHAFIHQIVACWRGSSDWIHQEIVHDFFDFAHLGIIENASHLCGWDTPCFTNSQAGHRFSATSIGHLGYTGCSMWVDLDKDWWVVLLTNRVHPTATNEKIKAFRPRLHDAIYDELIR